MLNPNLLNIEYYKPDSFFKKIIKKIRKCWL